MKREVKAIMKIEDGLHKGAITGVEERTEPYNYLDVVIEFEEGKQIKAGYPDFLSTESKLGCLLARFGGDVSTPGSFIDPEEILIGKKCQFMTLNKAKGDKTYANVVPESLKPCK
ncbi:MAG: hypothetical protein U9N86_10345 [Bacteroidota bacterium]|nr:hypothetical protein [Bacteroidota bacterium]